MTPPGGYLSLIVLCEPVQSLRDCIGLATLLSYEVRANSLNTFFSFLLLGPSTAEVYFLWVEKFVSSYSLLFLPERIRITALSSTWKAPLQILADLRLPAHRLHFGALFVGSLGLPVFQSLDEFESRLKSGSFSLHTILKDTYAGRGSMDYDMRFRQTSCPTHCKLRPKLCRKEYDWPRRGKELKAPCPKPQAVPLAFPNLTLSLRVSVFIRMKEAQRVFKNTLMILFDKRTRKHSQSLPFYRSYRSQYVEAINGLKTMLIPIPR